MTMMPLPHEFVVIVGWVKSSRPTASLWWVSRCSTHPTVNGGS